MQIVYQKITILALVLSFASATAAQEKGEPITVHVKEVHRVQESVEKGVWTRIKAIVETKTVIYSLECSEFASVEKGYTLVCSNLSAGHDYSARKFETSINFWPPSKKETEGPLQMAYEIVSEKEK